MPSARCVRAVQLPTTITTHVTLITQVQATRRCERINETQASSPIAGNVNMVSPEAMPKKVARANRLPGWVSSALAAGTVTTIHQKATRGIPNR